MPNYIRLIGQMIRAGQLGQTGWTWDERRAIYAVYDQYYDSTIYNRNTDGGQRDGINEELGNAAATDLASLYNPVAEVVDLYLKIFAGAFGDEITITPTGDGGQALIDAIGQVWKWSNLTTEKRQLCRLPATHGLCGIRIVGRDDPDPSRRRVYLKAEHPSTIRDMILDDRGNVEEIQLEYDITAGLAEEAQTITIREQLSKTRIRTWRTDLTTVEPFDVQAFIADGMPANRISAYDGGPGADYPNPLGVTPYVICYYDKGNDIWGRNAWARARGPIDRLNALMSHIDIQIHEHVRVAWLVAASGAAPAEFDLSGRKVIYVNTANGASVPTVQALVSNLSLQDATAQARFQLEAIEDKLPELKATAGRFLSGQSGETVAELRKPAEDRIQAARDLAEDALIRAQQIAVSWGVMLGIFDLGTGSGDRAAADRAYREGYEDHKFNKRPLLNDLPQAAPTPAQPGAQLGTFAVGDRVRVKAGMEHNGMGGAGTVAIVDTAALGIAFDAMPGSVHKWYVASELEPEASAPPPPNVPAAPRARAPMEMPVNA